MEATKVYEGKHATYYRDAKGVFNTSRYFNGGYNQLRGLMELKGESRAECDAAFEALQKLDGVGKTGATMKAKLRRSCLEKHAAAMWEALDDARHRLSDVGVWNTQAHDVCQGIEAELAEIEKL